MSTDTEREIESEDKTQVGRLTGSANTQQKRIARGNDDNNNKHTNKHHDEPGGYFGTKNKEPIVRTHSRELQESSSNFFFLVFFSVKERRETAPRRVTICSKLTIVKYSLSILSRASRQSLRPKTTFVLLVPKRNKNKKEKAIEGIFWALRERIGMLALFSRTFAWPFFFQMALSLVFVQGGNAYR